MKKFKLEIAMNNGHTRKSRTFIQFVEIMAKDTEDAKRRFYLAVGEEENVFVLNAEEIELNRPELKRRYTRKTGVIDNNRKGKCGYCSKDIKDRRPVIRNKHKGIKFIIDYDYHLRDVDKNIVITSSPLTNCPMCNKKF